MEKVDVMRMILQERDAQDAKFGDQVNNSYTQWMTILGEEFGETCQEALRLTFGGETPERLQRYIEETVQVAAVAFAMLEHIDIES